LDDLKQQFMKKYNGKGSGNGAGNERMDFLLNHKGRKFKANTLIGIIWKFLRNK